MLLLLGFRRYFEFKKSLQFWKTYETKVVDHGEIPAAGKPLYEAQYSDFLRRKNTGLRDFWRNWRNCARICACVDACTKKLRQNCAKIASFSIYCVNFPTFSKLDWMAQLIE